MVTKILNAFLPHDDRDAAVEFWCDKLGFELRNDVGYNGMHWLTVGPPDQPDVNLVLFPPGADPGVTDDERRTITEMMAKGTYAMLTLGTEDLELLIVLNNGTYQSISLTAWMAANPHLLLSTNFKVPESTFANFPKTMRFMPG